ncbi:hypothetical protein AMECASPLE_010454 [Ameca splendens]|uniref:Uncharacterized protein n=1 Tax=Ameca splendens TaxID=208324 RepID=A0ABV0ZBP3_9TELE
MTDSSSSPQPIVSGAGRQLRHHWIESSEAEVEDPTWGVPSEEHVIGGGTERAAEELGTNGKLAVNFTTLDILTKITGSVDSSYYQEVLENWPVTVESRSYSAVWILFLTCTEEGGISRDKGTKQGWGGDTSTARGLKVRLADQ